MATIFGQQTPGIGLSLQTISCLMYAHADITRGDLVAVSKTVSSDGDKFTTTSNVDNDNLSVRDQDDGIFVVAMESVKSGEIGRFALQGIVEMMVRSTSETDASLMPEVGWVISPQEVGGSDSHTGNAGERAQTGHKIVGYAMEDGVNGQTCKVFFDGLVGFGQK